MFQTVCSFNQLIVNGAVTGWCYQIGLANEEKERVNIPLKNWVASMMEPEEVEMLVSPSETCTWKQDAAKRELLKPEDTSYVVISRETERFVNEIRDHKAKVRSSNELLGDLQESERKVTNSSEETWAASSTRKRQCLKRKTFGSVDFHEGYNHVAS